MTSKSIKSRRGGFAFLGSAAALLWCLVPAAASAEPPFCGNGVLEEPEQCDLGSGESSGRNVVIGFNGDPNTCCTSNCTFRAPQDTCRPQDGLCDVAEMCTGGSALCPADAVVPTNGVCHASAGLCDVVETCDGISKVCPADAYLPSNSICHPSSQECNPVEVCNGVSPTCPTDVNNCTAHTATPTAVPTATPSPIPNITCPVVPLPPASCRQITAPRRHRLSVSNWNNRFDRRDRVEWGWRRGEPTTFADYGDPTMSTSYAICMYNGLGTLTLATSVGPGSKWKKSGYSYTFTNPALDEFGIRRISLKSRGAGIGRASIRVVAGGREKNLGNSMVGTSNFPVLGPFPIAAAPQPIRFMMINSIGNCWEGHYQSRIRRNAAINSFVSRLRAQND